MRMTGGGTDLAAWEILENREIFTADPWVRLSVERILLPDGRVVEDYYQVRLLEYAVIVAQIPDGRVILERQYKRGVGKVTLTLPAGGIAEGESPREAARRELREETGFTSADWRSLGSFVCSANHGCGRAHAFHARDVGLTATPNSGDLEEMEIIDSGCSCRIVGTDLEYDILGGGRLGEYGEEVVLLPCVR